VALVPGAGGGRRRSGDGIPRRTTPAAGEERTVHRAGISYSAAPRCYQPWRRPLVHLVGADLTGESLPEMGPGHAYRQDRAHDPERQVLQGPDIARGDHFPLDEEPDDPAAQGRRQHHPDEAERAGVAFRNTTQPIKSTVPARNRSAGEPLPSVPSKTRSAQWKYDQPSGL